MYLNNIKKELRKRKNRKKAEILQRFFKTKKGEYGENDVFLGVTVPETRKIAERNNAIHIQDLTKLLKSNIHEERLVALLILIYKFKKGNQKEKERIIKIYLRNLKWVNNWDLVDLSAYKILGNYLFDKKNERKILYDLSASKNLWKRRVAVISTFYFIKNNDFTDAIKISEILLKDNHDLIHKAVGWMLREIGKRDFETEEIFIKKNYDKIHRTTLRYAIEKFPEQKRKYYLKEFNSRG